ncbi:MAG: DUF2812 domain-containing protein [Bacillus sp. (in: firmicutes)]
MRKYKYVANMGLAFDEKRILKKLSKLAKEGWILDELTLLRGYRLKRSQPRDVVYSLDYKRLDQADQAEYVEMFEAGGWEHICSLQDMHFFAAPPGTTPIYTDKESHQHMYRTQRIQFFRWSIIGFIISMLVFVSLKIGFSFVESEFLKHGLSMVAGISAGITFSFMMMVVAFYWRERRIETLK